MSGGRPALFLDRDGVINEEVHYLWRPADCRLVEGIGSLLRTANEVGYMTVVVTNQAGIGRGMYTEEDFHALMRHISAELAAEGASLDAIYFSPFHPEKGVGAYRRESDCRKPGPGMFLRAAAEHDLNLSRSVLVGDRCTDMEAGASAGVGHMFLFGDTEQMPCAGNAVYDVIHTFVSVERLLRDLHESSQTDTSSPGGIAS